MEFNKIFECSYQKMKFRIEEDRPEVGWYLFVFNENGECIADYLQNDLAAVISFAHEKFNVPPDIWTSINKEN